MVARQTSTGCALIDISGLRELAGITETDNGVRIGANETLSEIIIVCDCRGQHAPFWPKRSAHVGAVSDPQPRDTGRQCRLARGLPGARPSGPGRRTRRTLRSGSGGKSARLTDWLATADGTVSLITCHRHPPSRAGRPRRFPQDRHARRLHAQRHRSRRQCYLTSTAARSLQAARLATGGGTCAAGAADDRHRKRAGRTGIRGDRLARRLRDQDRSRDRCSRRCAAQCAATANAPAQTRLWRRCPDPFPGERAWNSRIRSDLLPPAQPDEDPPVTHKMAAIAGTSARIWRRRFPANLAYLTDARRDDMLVGAVLRLDQPHARILSIDTRRGGGHAWRQAR